MCLFKYINIYYTTFPQNMGLVLKTVYNKIKTCINNSTFKSQWPINNRLKRWKVSIKGTSCNSPEREFHI